LERRQQYAQHMIATAVTREINHHDVLLGVDRRTDLVQRLAQIGYRGGGNLEQRSRIVDERDRPAFAAPSIIHHLLRSLYVLAKHVVGPIAGKPDKIEIRDVGSLVFEIG